MKNLRQRGGICFPPPLSIPKESSKWTWPIHQELVSWSQSWILRNWPNRMRHPRGIYASKLANSLGTAIVRLVDFSEICTFRLGNRHSQTSWFLRNQPMSNSLIPRESTGRHSQTSQFLRNWPMLNPLIHQESVSSKLIDSSGIS